MIYFKNIKKNQKSLYNILIAIFVIMLWRGVWGILDLFLFPSNELLSYVLSAGLAISFLYVNDFSLSDLDENK